MSEKLPNPETASKLQKIAIFFILSIIYLSINNPIVDFREISRRVFDSMPSEDFRCLKKSLPSEGGTLFFSRLDGTYDPELSSTYFTIQYNLAPKLISASKSPSSNFSNEYQWFITWSNIIDSNKSESEIFPFRVIKQCGDFVILKRDN
jgi:hypothetical protein